MPPRDPQHWDVRRHRNGFYTVTFHNTHLVNTTVTSSTNDVFRWIFETLYVHHRRLSDLVVGLTIKRRPILQSSADQRSIALLQLCFGYRCLIFQIFRANYIPSQLSSFLRSSNCYFVGVGMSEIADLLRDEYGLTVRNAVDLRELAAEQMGRTNLQQARLRVLAREVIRWNINIRSATEGWDRRRLSNAQIARACAEAFMASVIGRWLIV